MADGVKALRKLQIGKETVPGTAVAATALLKSMSGVIEDTRVVTFPTEANGNFGGSNRSYVAAVGAQMTMEGIATFEEIQYVLRSAFVNDAAPTTDTGSACVWNYNAPTVTAVPSTDLATCTIEAGDNQEAEEMEFSYVESFSMSGRFNEAWNVSAVWKGRQCSTSTFTSLASSDMVSVEEMLFNKTKLYIDPTTDTIGTTQIAGTLIGATWNYETGWMQKPVADGNLYFQDVKQIGPTSTLELVLEHNTQGSLVKDAFKAGTAKQLRLEIIGNALTTTDATHSTKLMYIDMAGKWESVSGLDEQDGDDIITATFRAGFDTNADLFIETVVQNERATLV